MTESSLEEAVVDSNTDGENLTSTLRRITENSRVRGGALVAASLAALLMYPDQANAIQDLAQETVEKYGMRDGVKDALFILVNILTDFVSDSTLAADRTGSISHPSTPGYKLMYAAGVVYWSLAILFAMNETSKKAIEGYEKRQKDKPEK